MSQPDFGFLLVDKPSGPTSHDIVHMARRVCGTKKIGHGGTLDPLAEGLLVLAVGDATRLLEFVTHSTKAYQARILFGVQTTTDDLEGDVIARHPLPSWLRDPSALEALLENFRGEIEQIPPTYSAVKIDGQRAYQRARAQEQVEMPSRDVTIEVLDTNRMWLPYLDVNVTCSAGTYIRSLAREIGDQAGCGATLAFLRRVRVGSVSTDEAVAWHDFIRANEHGSWIDYLVPAAKVLAHLPRVELSDTEIEDIRHGRSLSHDAVQPGMMTAYSPSGRLLALLRGDPERGVWQPAKVFPSQFT